MYKLLMSEKYIKKEKTFVRKHPALKKKYKKVLTLLKANPHHPSLRLHKLQGNLKEYHSLSINLQYRIVLDFIITEKEIILIDIGTHGEVY